MKKCQKENAMLKKILINSTVFNVCEEVLKLKKIFTPYYNKDYLDIWFNFFWEDFLEEDINIVEKKYQWLIKNLQKFTKIVKEGKEPNFITFKLEKEKIFPWNEEIEFELLESTIEIEQEASQQIYENDEIIVLSKDEAKIDDLIQKINELEKALYWLSFSKKYALKNDLVKYDYEQYKIICFHLDSLNKLEILEKKQKSKFFKVKNKMFKYLTFGYYDMTKKIGDEIEFEKNNLNKQKTNLNKIGLKICSIKIEFEAVQKEIQQKKSEIKGLETEKFKKEAIKEPVENLNYYFNYGNRLISSEQSTQIIAESDEERQLQFN